MWTFWQIWGCADMGLTHSGSFSSVQVLAAEPKFGSSNDIRVEGELQRLPYIHQVRIQEAVHLDRVQ